MTNISLDTVRYSDGTLPAYADGGYPLFYFDRDECILCPTCANAEEAAGEEVTAFGINYEDTSCFCDNCSVQIEPAYDMEEGTVL